MPSRQAMLQTTEARARITAQDLGWDNVLLDDTGSGVEILLAGKDKKGKDIEQMAQARLGTIIRVIQDVGPCLDYCATEEYAAHEDPAMGVDAKVQARVDAGDPDPFGEEALNAFDDRILSEIKDADAAAAIAEAEDHADEPTELEKSVPAEVVELAQEPLEVKPVRKAKRPSRSELVARCKELKIVGYTGLRVKALQALIKNAEHHRSDLASLDVALQRLEAVTGEQGLVEDYNEPEPATIVTMSPKEVAQAAEIDDQDRGGLPQSQQIVSLSPATLAKMEEIEFKGRTIIARQGNDARVLGSRIKASVKAQWESEGWTFTHTTKEEGRKLLRTLTAAKRAAANIGTAAVSITHKRDEALVERHPNGRTHAKPGYVFRIFKGNKSFEAATVNEALWRNKGWNLAIVRA